MQLIRRYRIPALFCAFAVLFCELVSRPYANMGICDDGPYILIAQKLAATGHVFYNGWPAAMLGWQLYLGAAFVKLFGSSFTTVRMSTLLVAMALAFVLQRTLVRANISERNATIGTLALVLSPLYLLLSVTFMSDITGLFAIVICMYGCIRSLQAATSNATLGWLCFAVATNALCGTARQIAWLGILVMVPSTLWLLRTQRRVLIVGSAATLAGALFIFACMHWFAQQPYIQPEHLLVASYPVIHMFWELTGFFLDAPFLLLPIAAVFLPEMRSRDRRSIVILTCVSMAYIALTIQLRHRQFLEPTYGDWVNMYGIVHEFGIWGAPTLFLNRYIRALLTLASLGGLLGLIYSFFRSRPSLPAASPSAKVSWKQLAILFTPYTLAYILLLIPRAASVGVSDRYLVGLLVVALPCLVRYYQDRIQPQLPFASILLIAIMAIYGIAVVHNTFALYRARVTLAAELSAEGIADTSVDGGWEHNLVVELQHTNHLNYPTIVVPANAYVPTPPLPAGICPMFFYDYTPHIHPIYAISFEPNTCYGSAPFAPVHYSRWLSSTPGTLYVVHSLPARKP